MSEVSPATGSAASERRRACGRTPTGTAGPGTSSSWASSGTSSRRFTGRHSREEDAMLEGKLVRLRALEPTDIERAYTWINDREVTRFLRARYPMSHADEERWLERVSTNDFTRGVSLAIETKEGEHIGNIGLEEPS